MTIKLYGKGSVSIENVVLLPGELATGQVPLQSLFLTNIKILQNTTHLTKIQVKADSVAVQCPTLLRILSPGMSSSVQPLYVVERSAHVCIRRWAVQI